METTTATTCPPPRERHISPAELVFHDIKFRVFYEGHFIYFSLADAILCNVPITVLSYPPDRFTGYQNRRREDIYENDIFDNDWIVKFYDGRFVFCNPIDEPPGQCAKETFDHYTIPHSEPTGNIHERRSNDS